VTALPVYAVGALILVFIWFSGLVDVSYENPVMTLLLNTLVVTSISAWVATLALRGYLASGLPEMLYAGCGLVAMGASFLLAGLTIGSAQGPNHAVTVHNLGVFCASFFHLAAALRTGQPRVGKPDPTAFRAVSAYLGVLALTGFFWAAAQYDLVPAFYIPGKGTTPVRQLVLTVSVAVLAVAAFFLIRQANRRGSLSLRCYGLGLGLIAMGLVDVSIAVPGSILSWTGRLSQGLGHLYLLTAFMTAIRRAVKKGLDVREAAADYYLESEDHYRALVNALRAAVISLDPKERVVLWNPQAEAIAGYRYAEAAGRPLTDLIAPEGDGREAFRNALKERSGRYLEMTLRRKDGGEFPADVIVFAAGGGWTQWTNLIIRETSDRKQAEEELRKRELRLRQALLVSRSFAFEWNPITDEVTRSEECGPLLGLTGDEAIRDSGENFFQRVHPDDCGRFVAVLRGLTPNTPSYITKYRLVRPDGRVTTLEETGLGSFDAAGRLNRLTGITTDVTDREKAETEMAYLATFPKLNPNPIIEANLDGHVLFCNPTAARLFPDLQQRGKGHPWLSDWSTVTGILGEGLQKRVERQVEIGGKWYFQTLHFVPESWSFRIYGVDVTGLQEAEQALRENQADLNWAQAVGRIGSWRLNVQRNELLWSDQNHRIFGVPKDQPMSYETFLATVHPEDRAYVDRKWTAALNGEPYDIEHRIVVGNTVKWVRERAELEFDAAGQLLGGFGITQDISDRKEAEKALRESEARFRLLANTAEELLTTDDPQSHVRDLAGRVMAHLDCHCFFNFLVVSEELGRLRMNAWAGIPEEEARRIEWLDFGVAVCGCVARDGRRIVAERIPTTPDVRTELVKSYGIKAYACHPLTGVDGRVLGTLSFGTRSRETFSADDLALMKAVTDQVAVAMVRMQNEQALRNSEEALRKVNEQLEETVRKRTLELEDTVATLKNEIIVRKKIQTQLHQLSRVFMDAADPIIIEDLSGMVVEMNREAEAVYGWSRDELAGKPATTLFLPEFHHLAAHLRERCGAGQEIRNREGMQKAKSGRVIPSLLTAFPLMDESGEVAFVATICKDISARKEMEARLQEAQRHLQALSRKSLEAMEADRRSVARELHDSLGGSLAAIKFGLEEVAGQAVVGPVCGSALLGTLISHLADTIKETKRISANLRPLSIDDLGLLATIEWYTRQFSQRYEDIHLVRQIEVEEHEIPEDYKIVVYRVIQEALTNAAKHSKADTIHIRLKKDAGYLELEVEDNGCGFNPRQAVESGDGLSGYGLRGMQERAEICGGSISIHSRPGAGTHIKAALPFSETLFER
jgi:PAS domain S-box-containing protein